jgi:hypothetical protein
MDLKNIKLKKIDEENLFKFDSKIKDEFEYQTKETIDTIESRNIPNNNNKIIEKLPNELIKTFTGLGENSDDTTYNSTSSSVLSEYAIDLTEMASSGQLDPVLGRISEIERLMQILVRRRKNNAILIGDDGVINEEGLRYPDELVKHKTLDFIGDIYLAGYYILGQFNGVKTGHGINNKILLALLSDETSWRLV